MNTHPSETNSTNASPPDPSRTEAIIAPGDQARLKEWYRSSHSAYLRTILRLFGWPSANRAGAYLAQNAWLLTRHGDATPALQLCVLKLIERQASTPAERTNLAYLTDHVLLARGEPQMYGTQVTVDDLRGLASPRTLRDPENVDARRRAVGLGPLADYLRGFEPGHR